MRTNMMVAASLAVLAGCAGNGLTHDGGTLEQTIGSTSLYELTETTSRILASNSFQIDRMEREPRVVIETLWRDRRPFTDELAVGIEEAQTRVVIMGNRRSSTPLGALYGVRLRVENRVRVAGSDEWRYVAASPSYREWVDQLTGTLRRELTMGVRVF